MGKWKCEKWEKSEQSFRSVTGKIRSKPTFQQCQFIGQDVVRTFKKYGIKWNGMEKNWFKGDGLLTVTLGVSGKAGIWKLGICREIFEESDRKKRPNLELSLQELKNDNTI